MFRDYEYVCYRPENNDTNHASTITRKPKKKELLHDKKCQLLSAKFGLDALERCSELDGIHIKMIKDKRREINRLEREIEMLNSQTIEHKSIHKRKKMNIDKVYASCVEAIKESLANNIIHITAEDVAFQLDTPVYLVKQCFMKLNLIGALSQPTHELPHDCFRPECSGWSGNIYYIYDKAKTL